MLTAVLDRPARWGTQWTTLTRRNFPYTFESGYYIRNADIESSSNSQASISSRRLKYLLIASYSIEQRQMSQSLRGAEYPTLMTVAPSDFS
jgi:hypothetical protein